MYDLTCINGMADFDLVAQWLVPFAGPVLPGGEEPLLGLHFFRRVGKVGLATSPSCQNFQGAVVIDDTGRLEIDELDRGRKGAGRTIGAAIDGWPSPSEAAAPHLRSP